MDEFTETVGLTVYVPSDPLGCFSVPFDNDQIDTIVRETNRYAQQVLESQQSPTQWVTTAEEMKAYFVFCIFMGIHHLPEIRDYWSSNTYLHYTPIADRIAHDRFEQISKYLHLANNETSPQRGQPGYSCLQKVEPVLSAMKEKCKSVYQPGCQLCVDEAMVPFKGRLSLKQYMPKKPIMRCFKVWITLTRAHTHTHYSLSMPCLQC